MRYRRLETAPRRRAFLITQPNFSDIGQRWWDLTRPGGPKSESIGRIQSVGSSKPNRFPPGVPFKPLFQGQTYLATYTKTGLILLILLRNTGATASGGGATAASYLLFTKPFTDELISLCYRDTMWDREAMENFFGTV